MFILETSSLQRGIMEEGFIVEQDKVISLLSPSFLTTSTLIPTFLSICKVSQDISTLLIKIFSSGLGEDLEEMGLEFGSLM